MKVATRMDSKSSFVMENLQPAHSAAFKKTILDAKHYGAVRVDSIIVQSTPAIAACAQIERFAKRAISAVDILLTFSHIHSSRKVFLCWIPNRFRRHFITQTERQAIYAARVALTFLDRAIASLKSSSQSVIDLDLCEFLRVASDALPGIAQRHQSLRELRSSYSDFFAHNDGLNYRALLSSGNFIRLKAYLSKTMSLSMSLESELVAQRTAAVQILASENWDSFGALAYIKPH